MPLTSDIRAAYVAERLEGIEDQPEARHAVTQLFDRMPFPEMLPAFGRLIASTDRRLWVQVPQLPGDTITTFSVFDANGAWLDVVQVPSGFHVYEVGSGYVLGRWRDELDVQHVRLYALEER